MDLGCSLIITFKTSILFLVKTIAAVSRPVKISSLSFWLPRFFPFRASFHSFLISETDFIIILAFFLFILLLNYFPENNWIFRPGNVGDVTGEAVCCEEAKECHEFGFEEIAINI